MGADMQGKTQDITNFMEPKIENLKDRSLDFGSEIGDNAQQITSDTVDLANEKANQASQKIKSSLKTNAIGQYLKTNIMDQADEIIASLGDMVTAEILTEAEENDQLDLLLVNLSKDPINKNSDL